MADVLKIRSQEDVETKVFEAFFKPVFDNLKANETAIISAIDAVCDKVEQFAREKGGIVVLTDRHIAVEKAALPMIMLVSAVNQRLIEEGLRLNTSIIVESGQIASAHQIACLLGFGAAAVYPLAVRMRAEQKFSEDPTYAYQKFVKAAEKSLMKTMGKVGLCTVESYSGG